MVVRYGEWGTGQLTEVREDSHNSRVGDLMPHKLYIYQRNYSVSNCVAENIGQFAQMYQNT